MKVTIETARWGFIVRDSSGAEPVLITEDDPVDSVVELLTEVNHRIGQPGQPDSPRRVLPIVLPGVRWTPDPDSICAHDWVRRSSTDSTWSCPCGARFGLVADDWCTAEDAPALTPGARER